MKDALLIAQIVISTLLVVTILMQAKGTGIGTAFGGSESYYHSKRGVEKLFIYFTIILAVLFFLISIIQVLI